MFGFNEHEGYLFILCQYRAKNKWAQHLRYALSLTGLILAQLETEKRHDPNKIL